jgi:hypothetical protein
MNPGGVLAINCTTLDGKVEHEDVYFDLKAFGFNGRLAKRLHERLQEIPDEQVLTEE